MKKIYIVAPGNQTSGGPELCHQLADILNRDIERAFILYYPFIKEHEIPSRYQKYNFRAARLQDVEPGSIVIVPEVFALLVKLFPNADVYFWWLSVDNFFTIVGQTSVAKYLGSQRAAKLQLRGLRHRVSRHLYQSEYARIFLESVALDPTHRLSDCLADEYVHAITNWRESPRDDLLVYNPAKGLARTELILNALAENRNRRMPQVVAIEGMQPNQVLKLLQRAKVYIDFGAHPGKDRLPREAAALGACVIVNRRGSAANPTDVPIPEDFKIDDRISGFENAVAQKIHMLMDQYEEQRKRFAPYRQAIANEPAGFLSDIRAIFPTQT
ncbi:hypothetical protein [Mycobacterium sp. 050134]|uniref:hypothetical protein n=1 Tax=Mycobacterium sp. 050134 TaxID=3096111 RepID=UPI002ED83043